MSNEYLQMEIAGEERIEDKERDRIREGITWPGLVWLNSHYELGHQVERRRLLGVLKGLADERGMMPFFVSSELRAKYPPDLESTGLFASACHIHGEAVPTDLEGVNRMVKGRDSFPTWIGREDVPFDATSQVVMSLCYGIVGLDTRHILEAVLKRKFRSLETLRQRDAYYVNPLLLIYFTLFTEDKSVLPNGYIALISDFLETYEPADETEVAMIDKICQILGFDNPRVSVKPRKTPIFTHGNRQHVGYSSPEVAQIFDFSARRSGVNLIKTQSTHFST